MTADPKHLTILTLTGKNTALSGAATELKNFLTGDFTHDAPIQQQLGAVHAEEALIASRLAAITRGQPFTAPTSAQVNALGTAISKLNQDIQSSANLNSIIADTTNVLNQYGAKSSEKKKKG